MNSDQRLSCSHTISFGTGLSTYHTIRALIRLFGTQAYLCLLVGYVQRDIFFHPTQINFKPLASRPHLPLFSGLRLSPAAILPFISYLAVFLAALIRANLDMARRVLSPSLPLNPGVVEVKTRLKSSLGRLILANSITLTPGTLTVDLQGDSILIHWVDIPPGSDIESATRDVTDIFERHLVGFVK
ncbi:MAG: Na+/H+ antiporter subunit E [Candidatus Thiodiazotropha endolucinida]